MPSSAGDLLLPVPDPAAEPSDAGRLACEVGALRSLCADLYDFVLSVDEGDDTSCMEFCAHDTGRDGCCETGRCWYERRLAETVKEAEHDVRP